MHHVSHRRFRDRALLTKPLPFLAAVATLLLMGGCAGTTTFTAYPKKINPLIADLRSGKPIDFSSCLTRESRSRDMILYNMELGRIAQIVGNTDASMQNFSASMESIREKEQKAIISASGVASQAAAVTVNDNAIPYEGEGYERVMLYHFQAMNYLAKKDLEGAGVEIRRANAEQEEALKRHERELEGAQEEAEEKKVGDPLQNSALASQYAQLDEIAGKVKNSFQNAYTFYLSGVVYELTNQPNDAYIDYKKALEIFPGNSILQREVVRLARKLEMSQELDELKARFGIDPAAVGNEIGKDAGELLVLFEDGFAPQKQEVKIPIPVPKVGVIATAFPVYTNHWIPASPLVVTEGGAAVGSTEPICDIRALAVKSLKENVPALAIRQTLRAIAKGATAKMAKDKLGALGFFGATLWNLASENADLRSWITLPEDAQIMRVTLSAGRHSLTLQHEGSMAAAKVEVDIREGGKTILRVVRAGEEMYRTALVF